MPEVSVERVPVQLLHLGLLGFDHLLIVFRPAASWAHQDGWYVIEGVRDLEAGGGRLGVEGLHGATTLAEANGGRMGVELSGWIGTGMSRGSRIVAEGGEAIRVWSTLVSYASEIDAQKFPYIALAPPASPIPTINSSSLVASLLYYAGIDVEAARPRGLRFSPGMSTLLGTSMDDTMKAGRSFTTLVGGDGDDRLFGSEDVDRIDKMFGGRGNDTIHWSAGRNIIHGGGPGLDTADDGVDTVDYTGAGAISIEAAPRAPQLTGPNGALHEQPDFIVRHATGEDYLYSIEEIVWDAAGDSVSLGPGVALSPRPGGDATPMPGHAADAPHPVGACLAPHACEPASLHVADDVDLDIAIACGLLTCGLVPGAPAPLSDAAFLDIGGGHNPF
jgi:hypothetical protein